VCNNSGIQLVISEASLLLSTAVVVPVFMEQDQQHFHRLDGETRGISHISQCFSAALLRNVHAEQLHSSSLSSVLPLVGKIFEGSICSCEYGGGSAGVVGDRKDAFDEVLECDTVWGVTRLRIKSLR
jgi:hypothetical protein